MSYRAWPVLSMLEQILSLPERMLSLTMLVLAMYPVATLDITIRKQNVVEYWPLYGTL